MTAELVIVGGGPAGMAAATEAARAGVDCVLLDEGMRLGGQIYRQPPPEFQMAERPGSTALGRDKSRGDELRRKLQSLSSRVDVRSGTSVVAIWPTRRLLWVTSDDSGTLNPQQLILATGAYDRPVPFPGWTLPGVLTAGGTQTLMKAYGIRPGNRALVAGTGPLLLVVANQLHAAGVEVAAVLEAGHPAPPWRRHVLAAAWAGWRSGLLRYAWDYWRGVRRACIPLRFNHTIFAAHGERQVEGATFGPVDPRDWRPVRSASVALAVDLIVVGFGFVPNSELAHLAGCRLSYVHELGGWVPDRNARMETSVPGVLAAGDGAGIAGALVAEDEGRIAGITAAEQLGAITSAEADRRRWAPMRRLRSLARVRAVLDEMSSIRSGLSSLATPETIMCRCEEVRLKDVNEAVHEGARDLQAVKLLTRLGMGPCQGRNCGPSTAVQIGAQLRSDPASAGFITPRPPIKPVTLGVMGRQRECGGAEPVKTGELG